MEFTTLERFLDKPENAKIASFLAAHPADGIRARTEVGDGIYVNYGEYDTKSGDLYEAHRKYIDVQVMLEGEEKIFFADLAHGKETKEYNADIEAAFGTVADEYRSTVAMHAGDVAVFYPEDWHAPGQIGTNVCHVRKLIFKVPV